MYSISFVIFNERRYKDPYAHFILFLQYWSGTCILERFITKLSDLSLKASARTKWSM